MFVGWATIAEIETRSCMSAWSIIVDILAAGVSVQDQETKYCFKFLMKAWMWLGILTWLETISVWLLVRLFNLDYQYMKIIDENCPLQARPSTLTGIIIITIWWKCIPNTILTTARWLSMSIYSIIPYMVFHTKIL